jgi:hypothetical protein
MMNYFYSLLLQINTSAGAPRGRNFKMNHRRKEIIGRNTIAHSYCIFSGFLNQKRLEVKVFQEGKSYARSRETKGGGGVPDKPCHFVRAYPKQ